MQLYPRNQDDSAPHDTIPTSSANSGSVCPSSSEAESKGEEVGMVYGGLACLTLMQKKILLPVTDL